MKHFTIVFLILFYLITGNYSRRLAGFYFDEIEKGDKFIDDFLLDMVHEHGHEYDPYILGDSSVGFSKKVTFVNFTGEAKLHNGYILGLRSLHRPDHCRVSDEEDRLVVRADLGAGVLKMHYDGTVKFMSFGPTISVYGEIAYVEIHMKFSVDPETGRDGELHEFYIQEMKGVNVWITGLGPLNWAVNYLISGVTSVFQGYLKNMLEKKVRNHVEERLPEYQFPVQEEMTETPEISQTEITEQLEDIVAFAHRINGVDGNKVV